MVQVIEVDEGEEYEEASIFPPTPRTADGSLDWRATWRSCSPKSRLYLCEVAKDPTVTILDAIETVTGHRTYITREYWKRAYGGFVELEDELRNDFEFCADFLGKITFLLSLRRLNEILMAKDTGTDDFIKASGHVINAIVSPPRHTRARFTKQAVREAAEKADSEWYKYLK